MAQGKQGDLSPYSGTIQEASTKYGVPVNIIDGVILAESNGDPNATSRTGAQGLMQLEPGTAAGLGVSNSFDPAANIMGGTHYLQEQMTKFNDPIAAIAAYNAGPQTVTDAQAAWGPNWLAHMPDETQSYVKTVTSLAGIPPTNGGSTGGGSTAPAQSVGGSSSAAPGSQSTQSLSWIGQIEAWFQNVAVGFGFGALAVAFIAGGFVIFAASNKTVRQDVEKGAALA